MAIRQGIIEQKHYPFGRGGILIKFPQSMKIGLSVEEVRALEEIDLTDDPPQSHARNIWLISFYFAGMRISDVLSLKWSDFKDGRLYYRMAKNSKPLSLKVPEKAQQILSLYVDSKIGDNDLIFPELRKANLDSERDIKRKIANATKVLNKHLGPSCGEVRAWTSRLKPISLGIPLGDCQGIKFPFRCSRSSIGTQILLQLSIIRNPLS